MPPSFHGWLTLNPHCQVTDLKARLKSVPRGDYLGQSVLCFPVSPFGSYYGLESSGDVFCVFSKKTCLVFDTLRKDRHIRLQAYLEHEVLEKAKMKSGRRGQLGTLTADINIYGSRKDASEVGSVLHTSGICLQQPNIGLDGFTYYNPHVFHAQEVMGQYVVETPLLPLHAITLNTTNNSSRAPDTQLDADTEVTSMFDSLTHHHILRQRDTDRRIKTGLKEYEEFIIHHLDFDSQVG